MTVLAAVLQTVALALAYRIWRSHAAGRDAAVDPRDTRHSPEGQFLNLECRE